MVRWDEDADSKNFGPLQLTQVLCNIQVFTKVMPSLFDPNFEDFFINTSDAYQVKSLKLEIISSIATDESISVIFQELQGLITTERSGVDPAASPFAKSIGEVQSIGLREGSDLLQVVKKVKPHVLVGFSGVGDLEVFSMSRFGSLCFGGLSKSYQSGAYQEGSCGKWSRVAKPCLSQSTRIRKDNKLLNGVVNSQKSLEDCKYVSGLLEEWWEQLGSTVVDWVTVDGQNVAVWNNHVKQLLAFYDKELL
ncbi:unnamed protein product [Lactuca virosa]|nr:unnamed protein product [Lactuca virosa]